MFGTEYEAYHEFGGERLAITEFNKNHPTKKIAQLLGLKYKRRIPSVWNDQIYLVHDFTHPKYSQYCHPDDTNSRSHCQLDHNRF